MLTTLREVKYLPPREIGGLGKRYVRHPGPYAIGEAELQKLFPGIPSFPDMHVTVEGIGEDAELWLPANLGKNTQHVKGDADPYNLILLDRIVAHLQPKTILEVGTFRGKTTHNLAINTPEDAQIITIDIPKEKLTGQETMYGTDVEYFQPKEKIGAFFKDKPSATKIKQIFADSTSLDAHKQLDDILQGTQIDLAFIDAGHDYENVKRNYEELVGPRMRLGGVMMLDNYGLGNVFTHVGVSDYVLGAARGGRVFYFYAPGDKENKHRATSCLVQPWIPECFAHRWEREVAPV